MIRFHRFMSQFLIRIGEVFIRWSNWHYEKLPHDKVEFVSEEEYNRMMVNFLNLVRENPKPPIYH